MALFGNNFFIWIIISCFHSVFCQENLVGKCIPINIEMCGDLGYNKTFVLEGGENILQQAEVQLKLFQPFLDNDCSHDLRFFLCSFYLPKCDEEFFSMVRPCRELCLDVSDSCEEGLKKLGLLWPNFNCDQLPSEDDPTQECLKPVSGNKNLMPPDTDNGQFMLTNNGNTQLKSTDLDQVKPVVAGTEWTPESFYSNTTHDNEDVDQFHKTITYMNSSLGGKTEDDTEMMIMPAENSGSQESAEPTATDVDEDKIDHVLVITDREESGSHVNVRVDNIEPVVDHGIETGQIGIKNGSVHRGSVDRVITHPRPVSPCEPLHIEMCKQFGYKETKMPNYAGHITQVDATLDLSGFIPLIQTGCSSQLAFLLCSVYTPACHERFPEPLPPCRSVCLNVQRECLSILKQFGIPWPADLECINFPISQEESCLLGSADIFRASRKLKPQTVEKSVTQTFVVTTNSTVRKGTVKTTTDESSKISSEICLKDPEIGPCRNFTTRWYYNQTEKDCRQFWYGGCDPGDNNFATREECQNSCHDSKSGENGVNGNVVTVDRNALCRQNQDRGTCSIYKAKWYYSYNDKQCKRFWYGGCGGNTNRFDTEQACKAACISSDTVLPDTNGGGIDNTRTPDTGSSDICQLPSVRGSCINYKVKWFYNSTTRSCGRFWYSGCDGNANNFPTQGECEARCIIKVTTVAPLPTTKPGECPRLSINNIGACVQACNNDIDCSGNQKCCSNGCGRTCQDPADSYLLSPPTNIRAAIISADTAFVTWTDQDAADATERRIYSIRYKPLVAGSQYKVLNASAEQVYVTGLEPNQQYEFNVKVIQGGKFSLWSISAYNRTQGGVVYKPGECPAIEEGEGGICVEGCSSDSDCGGQMKCCSNGCGRTCQEPIIVEVAPNGTPEPPAQYCSMAPERGSCANYTVKWHFSPQDGQCKRFWYGGCEGNKNNFDNEEDCDYACRRSVTPQDICQLPQVHGPCKAAHRRWHYDNTLGECREFLYGGCRGNENRFNTRAECLLRCGSDEIKLKVNGLYAMDKTNNKITLKWDPPVMSSIRQYRLSYMGERYYRDQVQQDSVSILDIPGSVSSYSINGLKPATQYQFNLTAIMGDGRRGPTENLITDTMAENPYYKPGECPRATINNNINPNCERLCQSDYDCSGDLKCCRDSCGMSCQAPSNTATVQLCYNADHGCCLDGVTVAQGPNYKGCPDACQASDYGCCDDGFTPATGNNQEGCEIGSGDEDNFCEQSVYQCCADGITPAQGPNKEGCAEYVPVTPKPDLGPVCQQKSDRGPCNNYTVKYFYNTTTSRCERFWYGGCQGNQNNFDSNDDCEAMCVQRETLPMCEQPKKTGKCRAYLERYYYNSQTGQCEQFVYGGCDGNDNNFETKTECERRCGARVQTSDRCHLPADVGPCRGNIPRWYFDRRTGECQEFGWGGCEGNLNNFIDKETCLSECSVQIVPDNRSKDICLLPSETGRCRAAFRRYFYDHNDGQCKQFIYGGCEGNENNFETIEACESQCNRQYVCKPYVESDVQCLAYIPRYRYVAENQDCEQFIYGGCLGNSNNFATIEACRQKCISERFQITTVETPVYDDICGLKPDTGPCRARNVKWFFNRTSSRCERFIYGGCQGNPNRFDTEDECDSFCNVEGSGEVTVDTIDSSYCHLPKESGECENSFPAWYYDHLEGVCKEFVFGGCGGNENRFTSREVCESSCSREVVCRLPALQGRCRASFRRFYHDIRTGQCKEFIYGGCEGNANNFQTREACGNKCGDAYVPDVTIAPIPQERCQQPKDYGTGQGNEVMYYFDTSINDCRPFWYSGSGGNDNRFALGTECRRICRYEDNRVIPVTPAPYTTPAPRPTPGPDTGVVIGGDDCEEDSLRGDCSNYTVKWYYKKDDKRCARFWYSGCGGNGNRFESEEQCKDKCINKGVYPTAYPTSRPRPSRPCGNSPWGCCPDGITEAQDFYFSNCRVYTGTETADLVDGNSTVIIEQPDRNVFIECRGPQGTVSWYRNGFLITSDNRYTVYENGSLLIGSLTEEDSGMYACRVSDGQNPPVIRRFRLQIEVPIKIFPTPNTIVVKPGENAFLHCQAYGSPQPTVSWSKAGQPITNTGRYYVYPNGTLIISNAQQSDISDYTCMARNGVSSPAQRLVRLTIRASLTARIKPVDGRLRVGENLYLTCQASGYPAPSVRWEKMGIELISTGRMTVVGENLRITEVTLDDTGMYTCIAINAEEKVEDTKSIQVIPKDIEIQDCKDSASVTMCRLIVRAGLCGYTDYSKQCCYSCDQSKLRG